MVPLVPILGVINCFGMMVFLPKDTWIRLVIWMALGIIIYFTYSRHHSKLGKRRVGRSTAQSRYLRSGVRESSRAPLRIPAAVRCRHALHDPLAIPPRAARRSSA